MYNPTDTREMRIIATTLEEASETVLLDVHPETDTMECFVARKLAADELASMAKTARLRPVA